jgi:uncharacterized membrane protein YGL010W
MADALQVYVTRSPFETFSPDIVEFLMDNFIVSPNWIGAFYGVFIGVRGRQANSVEARVLGAEFSGGQCIQATVQTAQE